MQYTQGYYGSVQYGMAAAEVPQPAQPVDLMAYLPEYWQEFAEMRALQGAAGVEAGVLREACTDLLQQFFVETATWGLECWEHAFGLETDTKKSYAFRREQIRAKLRGAGTTTRQMIINLASAFAGGEATVMEYPAESRFVVKFVGVKGVPPNLKGLQAAIEEVKPAHLAFEFAYTYNYWDSLRGSAWNSLSNGTWIQAMTV